VQANKAGLMEIADVFVVNKADRDGAEATCHDLEQMLDLSSGEPHGVGRDRWRPPVVSTVSTTGSGVEQLRHAIASHRAHLETTGGLEARRRQRLDAEMHRIVAERLRQSALMVGESPAFAQARDDVLSRRSDPWTATDNLMNHVHIAGVSGDTGDAGHNPG